MSKTRNQRRRDKARLALIVSIIAWAICIIALLATAPRSEAKADEFIQEADDGSLPGDDIPATEVCYIDPEEFEKALISANLGLANKIENVKVTYYCICEKCCGKPIDHPAYGITASGTRAIPGVSVGVDPSVIPLGSDIFLDYGDGEIHYMQADDTGHGISGNHIDVCASSHEAALDAGVKTATVYWV